LISRRRPRSLTGLAVKPLPRPHFAPCTITFGRQIDSVRWLRPSRPFRDVHDYLLPGFIDLQVNGAYDIDVMAATVSDLLELSHCLAHDGTTSWMPTVITAPLDNLERADAVIAEAMAVQAANARSSRRSSSLGAVILGLHLEGPFISPHRLGAHPPLNLLPVGDALERVMRLRSLRMITIAPELEGAVDAIPRLVARGVTVALGHSDATYAQTLAAVAAGATTVTHIFNAMRSFHHREPGLVGAALTHSQLYTGVIADGIHVHPAALSLVCRLPNTYLVSDRVAAAGAASVSLGSLSSGLIRDARVIGDAVRLPNGTLAGATASILDSLHVLARASLIEPAIFPRLSSGASAELLGLTDRARLTRGARADLLLLDHDFKLKAVFLAGQDLN
jgi:N-acetylglucosamine-6-phosphate deacetylase